MNRPLLIISCIYRYKQIVVKLEPQKVLKKYFSGDCSEEEKKIIEQLLLNEDNPSFSEYLKSEWESIPVNIVADQPEAEHRFRKVLKVIGKRERNLQVWYWAAAVLLIILTPLCYFQFNSPGLKLLTVSTKPGEQKDLVLSDGSHVWLNCASSITYEEAFGSHNRKIKMEGEVFFTVAKNEDKPFIVEFNDHYTQVLGTSFNIKAYQGDNHHRVTVIDGKVAVGEIDKDKLHQYAVLYPNESMTLSLKSDDYDKNVLSGTGNIVAWKRGEIQFHETLLPTVVAELKRWYNVDLVLKDKPGTRMPSFTVLIKPNTSLEDVLEILSMTNKISYQKIGGKIIITTN